MFKKEIAGNMDEGNPGIEYHPLPMTIELARHKEEEELREKYNIPLQRKVVMLGQEERIGIIDPEPLIIRQTNVFNVIEADLLNHWTADKPANISRSEILKIVDFYLAFVGPEFEEICNELKIKIEIMTDELWDDYANRMPFEIPYSR